MATTRDFYKALHDLTKFEIVGSPKESANQIRFIGRVKTRAISRAWARQYVTSLVRASDGNPRWSIDLSRYYFLQGGEVLWAWRVIIQAPNDMNSALDEIIRALRIGARPSPEDALGEITELPLVSPSPLRNVVRNGKGASNIKEKS